MTSVKNEFVSTENKSVLWSVLFENRMFEGLPQESYEAVHQAFEQTITSQGNLITPDVSLVHANKALITAMVQTIERFRPSSSKAQAAADSIRLFEAKKNELDSSMKVPIPEEPSFADETDMPIDGEKLDSLLEDTMRQRDIDMELAMNSNNVAAPPVKKVAWADQQTDSKTTKSDIPDSISRKLKPVSDSMPPTLTDLERIEAKLESIARDIAEIKSKLV